MKTRNGASLTPPLNRLVDCLWTAENNTAISASELTLPSGSVDLVFQLAGRGLMFNTSQQGRHRLNNAAVIGAFTSPYHLEISPRTVVVGVHFLPGAASFFFNCSIQRLSECVVPLDDLWHHWQSDHGVDLLADSSADEKFRQLEKVLLCRLLRPTKHFWDVMTTIEAITGSRSIQSVAEVQSDLALSHKHSIKVFRDIVGMAPKKFIRLRRFHTTLSHLAEGKHSLSGVAQECGYSDQAHFIRDFREFSGITPKRYRPASLGRIDHVSVDSL